MATTTIIPLHTGKGRTVATALGMTVAYNKNPDKTDGGEWVTAYECDPLIADSEFAFSKRQYAAITGRNQGERDVIGYHVRISFKPGETNAQTANRIGYDLAMKLTHGNHAFVCCTHVDKAHVHCHIAINSTSLDCTKKFRNFKGSSFAVRRIADYLCLEKGLSVINNPKPSRGSYAVWKGGEKPQTNRNKLKQIIDTALQNAKDYDAFIAAMIAAECEVKHGKCLSFKLPDGERFIRVKSLGENYTEDALRERLAGTRKVTETSFLNSDYKPNLLIDIQEKISEGAGEGYRQWMRIFNLKQAARTLLFLQQKGIDSYDDLKQKASSAFGEFSSLTAKIKNIETRLKEITELQKYIGQYSKTREVYKQYHASGGDEKFYETHRADITLHLAAKKHFDTLGLKKLPPINELKQEWAKLATDKKKLYMGYHKLKENSRALNVAKANADMMLGVPRNVQKSHDRGAR